VYLSTPILYHTFTQKSSIILCKFYRFLAVFLAFLKAEALGAPFDPGLRIVSPDPALIRLRLACMLLYSPLGIIF
jgi:hypothetical protein